MSLHTYTKVQKSVLEALFVRAKHGKQPLSVRRPMITWRDHSVIEIPAKKFSVFVYQNTI